MTIKEVSKDLYGLVLAGGQSSRMGFDKGLIEYHQHQPQRSYIYQLLSRFCSGTFLGLRRDQEKEAGEFSFITDSNEYEGPFRSILAAHEAYPKKAWLVVACDLPFLTPAALSRLIMEREPGKTATAYYNPEHDFPEPLLAIWEPEALSEAKVYAGAGNNSPGRFLKMAGYKKVMATDEQELLNVNKPDEYEEAIKKLKPDE